MQESHRLWTSGKEVVSFRRTCFLVSSRQQHPLHFISCLGACGVSNFVIVSRDLTFQVTYVNLIVDLWFVGMTFLIFKSWCRNLLIYVPESIGATSVSKTTKSVPPLNSNPPKELGLAPHPYTCGQLWTYLARTATKNGACR